MSAAVRIYGAYFIQFNLDLKKPFTRKYYVNKRA